MEHWLKGSWDRLKNPWVSFSFLEALVDLFHCLITLKINLNKSESVLSFYPDIT